MYCVHSVIKRDGFHLGIPQLYPVKSFIPGLGPLINILRMFCQIIDTGYVVLFLGGVLNRVLYPYTRPFLYPTRNLDRLRVFLLEE